MNRIEERMCLLKQKNEKAFLTYMMAGLPDMEGTKALMRAQQEAGADVIELGIPFSDPIADGQEGGVCGDMRRYLSAVRAACDIPVIAEIGACAPHTPAPVRELTDGVTARSHQIRLLEQTGYDIGAVQKFCIDFRKKLQQEVGTEGCLEGA